MAAPTTTPVPAAMMTGIVPNSLGVGCVTVPVPLLNFDTRAVGVYFTASRGKAGSFAFDETVRHA